MSSEFLNPTRVNNIHYACRILTEKYGRVFTFKFLFNRKDKNAIIEYMKTLKEFSLISYGKCKEGYDKSELLFINELENTYVQVLYNNVYIISESQSEKLYKDLKFRFEYTPSEKTHINVMFFKNGELDSNIFTLSNDRIFYDEAYPYVNSNDIRNSINSLDSGIILLHGDPGTGKSSFIQNLIRVDTDALFYYMDISLLKNLSSVNLLNFLSERICSNTKRHTVCIVSEDCEDILTTRNDITSMLLNLTSGLISQAINFKFIGTFNCDVSKIDPAIMRKGRLLYKQEFKPLTNSQAKALARKLSMNENDITNDSYTITDIFNLKEKSFLDQKNKIGF